MPEWIVKYWVEWLFGLVIALLTFGWKRLSKKVSDTKKEQDEAKKRSRAVEMGVQALLRAQMIADYNHYSEKGWAPIYARENFENCWKRYEELGENGVMQDIRAKFLALPTRERGNTDD